MVFAKAAAPEGAIAPTRLKPYQNNLTLKENQMKIPQAWSSQGASAPSAVTATKKVEARIDMSTSVAGAGLCPDCKQPMQPMVAAGVDTLTCMDCRIALPEADPEAVVQDDAAAKGSAGPSTYLDQ